MEFKGVTKELQNKIHQGPLCPLPHPGRAGLKVL